MTERPVSNTVSVSQLLLRAAVQRPRKERLYKKFSLAFQHFAETPIGLLASGGADSVAIELKAERVLKISEFPFFSDPLKRRIFDLPITAHGDAPLGSEEFYWEIQPKAETNITKREAVAFKARLKTLGFNFWDTGSDDGRRQLGRYQGGIWLLDPFAVVSSRGLTL